MPSFSTTNTRIGEQTQNPVSGNMDPIPARLKLDPEVGDARVGVMGHPRWLNLDKVNLQMSLGISGGRLRLEAPAEVRWHGPARS